MSRVTTKSTQELVLVEHNSVSCAALTRVQSILEDVEERVLELNGTTEGNLGKVMELFTVRDTHSLWCASLLPLVSSQALVGRHFGPATTAAGLEAFAGHVKYLRKM